MVEASAHTTDERLAALAEETGLVTATVKIGWEEGQVFDESGKPFPLVLQPAEEGINFIQLQEYFMANHEKIRQATSSFGAVVFSGF